MVIFHVSAGSQTEESLSFEKVLYRGSIEEGQVDHEDIIVPGFDGTTVSVFGGKCIVYTYTHIYVEVYTVAALGVSDDGDHRRPRLDQ